MSMRRDVGIGQIFAAFLFIGATSFGGGVIGYLRNSLVTKHRWLDDTTFVQILAISQPLPGLKATNIAILAGDHLRGIPGAIAALIGLCLPGAALMYAVGIVYEFERDRPLAEAALDGIAAAAVGLMLATTLELGRKSLSRLEDLVFVMLTVVCVNRFELSVPRVLIVLGTLASLWYGLVGAANRRPHR